MCDENVYWWVLICLLGVSAFAEGNGEKLQIEGSGRHR